LLSALIPSFTILSVDMMSVIVLSVVTLFITQSSLLRLQNCKILYNVGPRHVDIRMTSNNGRLSANFINRGRYYNTFYGRNLQDCSSE